MTAGGGGAAVELVMLNPTQGYNSGQGGAGFPIPSMTDDSSDGC